MTENEIRAEGAKALSEMLKKNTTLKSLYLWGEDEERKEEKEKREKRKMK